MNIVAAIFGALGVILCGAYSLWLYNRLIFGNLKISYTSRFKDLDLREFLVVLPLLVFVILMGVYPAFFLDTIHFAVHNLTIVTFY